MSKVDLRKVENNPDPQKAVIQLAQAHNLLVDRLEYVLTHLDDKNFTAAFLASLKEGGTTNGNTGPT